MPYLSEKDRESLERLVETLEKIERFAATTRSWQDLERDELRLDAILMNFINLGECVGRLSEPLMQASAHVPWAKIKGLRNIVAHDYWGTDVEMVWQVINSNLKKLDSDVREILETPPPNPS